MQLIRGYFNINYDGQSIEYNKGDKPSKELYAFFTFYLKASEKLKEEYEERKEDYEGEIKKFDMTDGIQRIWREFPAEESNNISNFLKNILNDINKNKTTYQIEEKTEYPMSVPKIQEILKPFKYAESEIREIEKILKKKINFDFKDNEKSFIYLHIIEYYLPPDRYGKIFKFRKKSQCPAMRITKTGFIKGDRSIFCVSLIISN